jgi:hypothetical protein
MLLSSSIPILTWRGKGRDRVKKRQAKGMASSGKRCGNPEKLTCSLGVPLSQHQLRPSRTLPIPKANRHVYRME